MSMRGDQTTPYPGPVLRRQPARADGPGWNESGKTCLLEDSGDQAEKWKLSELTPSLSLRSPMFLLLTLIFRE